MSNKIVTLPKYKWEAPEQIKQTPTPVPYKPDSKIFVQYSPKTIQTQSPKYFKPSSITRHYS